MCYTSFDGGDGNDEAFLTICELIGIAKVRCKRQNNDVVDGRHRMDQLSFNLMSYNSEIDISDSSVNDYSASTNYSALIQT